MSFDWIPGVSQIKSGVQLILLGDVEGAAKTQENFVTRCPGVSHVVGGVAATIGWIADDDEAKEFGMKAIKGGTETIGNIADSTPGVGHVKGVVHLACGDEKGGIRAFEAANRTAIVAGAGAAGFLAGGPVGAAISGTSAGTAYDGITSALKQKENFDSACPIVYIWYPDKNNPYGHAALQTDKYHISFWPDGNVKDGYGVAKAATLGIPGSLVFDQELDRTFEENQLPTTMYELYNTTNESINRIHEEFLRYNGIDPEDVTMEVAEKLVNERKEPKMSVSITRYTFLADIRGQVSVFDVLPVITQDAGNPLGAIAPSFLKPPWYHCKQSCVSFCYHMIENADPDPQSIETKLFDFVTLQSFDNFTVPWFENFIKKHWGKEIREPPKNIVHDIGRAVSDAILDNPVVNNSVTRTGRYWLWDRWTSN